MKQFKDFNIKPSEPSFTGEKVKMSRVLNKAIIVHGFKISESKFEQAKGSGKCLTLQITMNDKKHVVFTGSVSLMETIRQVPDSEFPFVTTIIEENERYQFT